MVDLSDFIELVRARPVLYDLSNPDYKDSLTIKKNNWIDVQNEWQALSGEELTCMFLTKLRLMLWHHSI